VRLNPSDRPPCNTMSLCGCSWGVGGNECGSTPQTVLLATLGRGGWGMKEGGTTHFFLGWTCEVAWGPVAAIGAVRLGLFVLSEPMFGRSIVQVNDKASGG
jgi:hypothetical protein